MNKTKGKNRFSKTIIAIATLTTFATTPSDIFAQTTSVQAAMVNQVVYFKDVPASHWAYSSIEWGRKSGIIIGYPDGTFKPNTSLTEAQLVTVLVRFFEDLGDVNSINPTNHSQWSDEVYAIAKAHNFPLKGYSDNKIRNAPVTRGVFAEVVYKAQGGTGNLDDAINWMFANNLTVGQSGSGTLRERYGVNSHLTRAHAVTFFQRLTEKGMTETNPNPMPPIQSKAPYNGPSKPLDLENATKLVESLPSFPADGNKVVYGEVVRFSTSPDSEYGVNISGDSKSIDIFLQKNSSNSDRALFKDILKHYFPNNYETVYNDALKNGAQTGKNADGIKYSTGHMLSQFDGHVIITK